MRADLAVYRQGTLSLVVEVKAKLGVTSERAARWRRNLAAHGLLPRTPYLMLATPDAIHLWKEASGTPSPKATEPDHAFDARELLEPYFAEAQIAPDSVVGAAFELIVSAWLHDLMRSERSELRETHPALVTSGLYDAIQGGQLQHEVAA